MLVIIDISLIFILQNVSATVYNLTRAAEDIVAPVDSATLFSSSQVDLCEEGILP